MTAVTSFGDRFSCHDIRRALRQVAESGTPGRDHPGILDVGTREFVDFFEREILRDLVAAGGATCRFFEGSYGAGKTHLLELLADRARQLGMTIVRIDLTAEASLGDWDAVVQRVLQTMELERDGERYRGLPEVLAAIAADGSVDRSTLDRTPMPHPGFRHAIAAAISTPAPESIERFLLGDRVLVSDLKRTGIRGVREPLNKKNAEAVLATVVGSLSALGHPGTMLLFDENENTFDSTTSAVATRKKMVAANIVRRLADAGTTGAIRGVVAVFAVLPNFLDATMRTYAALGQRLELPRELRADPPWRWPVLPVRAVSAIPDPDAFATAAVQRMLDLTRRCGGDATTLAPVLEAAAREALDEQAGPSYRRVVMRRLASEALEWMKASEPR